MKFRQIDSTYKVPQPNFRWQLLVDPCDKIWHSRYLWNQFHGDKISCSMYTCICTGSSTEVDLIETTFSAKQNVSEKV